MWELGVSNHRILVFNLAITTSIQHLLHDLQITWVDRRHKLKWGSTLNWDELNFVVFNVVPFRIWFHTKTAVTVLLHLNLHAFPRIDISDFIKMMTSMLDTWPFWPTISDIAFIMRTSFDLNWWRLASTWYPQTETKSLSKNPGTFISTAGKQQISQTKEAHCSYLMFQFNERRL